MKFISILLIFCLSMTVMVSCAKEPVEDEIDTSQKETNDTGATDAEEVTEIPGFVIDEALDVFEIDTPYGALNYPISWKDMIRINHVDDGLKYVVEFFARPSDETEYHIFDIVFGEPDGFEFGKISTDNGNISVSIKSYDVFAEGNVPEADNLTLVGMIEDINVIIAHLTENESFTLN